MLPILNVSHYARLGVQIVNVLHEIIIANCVKRGIEEFFFGNCQIVAILLSKSLAISG